MGTLIIMAISGISSLIGKGDNNKWHQQENLIVSEAEEYFLENFSNDLIVGENYEISLLELQKAGYLDVNISKECIKNSYVDIYVNGYNKYVYVPHISCFSERFYTIDTQPVVDVLVEDNIVSFEMFASHSFDNKILLSDYQIIVFQDDKELFTSVVTGINKSDIKEQLDLNDYTDNLDNIKIELLVRNNIGNYIETIIYK